MRSRLRVCILRIAAEGITFLDINASAPAAGSRKEREMMRIALVSALVSAWTLVGVAIVAQELDRGAGVAIPPPSHQTSSECLVCHDGSGAHAVRIGSSHLFAIDYESHQRFSRKFLRASNAPSGFGSTVASDMLVDGRVECTSCHVDHSVDTDLRYRFRTGADSTRLCRACHDPK